MTLELKRKEFDEFINEIPTLLKNLEEKIKKKINKDFKISFEWNEIEIVEKYFKSLTCMNEEDINDEKNYYLFVEMDKGVYDNWINESFITGVICISIYYSI